MSNSTHDAKAKTGRVQVSNLPPQEKELKDQEAENVKGGGGAAGGIVGSRNIGEEIPS